MITEKEIRGLTESKFFSRGKSLYSRRAVFDLDTWETEGKIFVEASVMGDSGTEYEAELLIEHDEIAGYSCTCPAAAQYGVLCKHGVAAALEYIRISRNRSPLRQQSYPFKKSTSSQIASILYMTSMEKQARFLQQEFTGTVELIPYAKQRPSCWEVEFKIGSTRKYVLKDIWDFAQAVERRESRKYGKQLEFIHEKNAFTQESLPLVNFVTACIRTRRELQTSSWHSFLPAGKEARNLRLTEKETAAFLDLFTGTSILWEARSQESAGNLLVTEQEPLVKAFLEKDENGSGYWLKVPPVQTICGEETMYLIKEDTAYRCNEEFRREMETFFVNVQNTQEDTFYIAEQDMTAFCTGLYPALRRNLQLSCREDLSAFLPEDCTMRMYLDKREGQITCKLESLYGEKKHNLLKPLQTGDLYRDMEAEGIAMDMAKVYFPYKEETCLWFSAEEEDLLYGLLSEGIAQLSKIAEVYVSDSLRNISIKRTPEVGISLDISGGLLDLQFQSEELPYEELEALLRAYRIRKKYYRMKDGSFLMLEGSGLEAVSELAEGLSLSGKALKEGSVQVPRYRSFYVDQVLKESRNLQVERSSAYKALLREMKAVEDSDFPIPPELKGVLRPYQKDGYRWLMTLEALGFGGILADDMGLGKSLQMLTFFKQQAREDRTSLLVCPASLVYNWQEEVEKFVPQLKVAVITGTAQVRRELLEREEHVDLLLTSYDLLKRDAPLYEGRQFYCQVLDEAQNIKNHNTQAAKAVKSIKAHVRFALTGTPIENRLSELWSIFDYLMPGILGSYPSFRGKYEKAIVQDQNEQAAGRLQRMINPFILRRLKSDVLKDLPEKWETVVYSRLEGEQRDLYYANAQQLRESIKREGADSSGAQKLKILAGLTRLRQLCCDPHLLYENYEGGASKLETCMELVRTAVDGGHKILLFSQFTSMLSILEENLKKEGIASCSLTGATSKEKRAELVKSFNKNDVPVFLISLKAGGTGLNLTAASVVIHFDPWWNAAAQNQATDRAHRIGQEQEVAVYKLIMQDTIEEKIQTLQEKKALLSQQVITGESMSLTSLSREEFMELLS